jgi:hypothetical protein
VENQVVAQTQNKIPVPKLLVAALGAVVNEGLARLPIVQG